MGKWAKYSKNHHKKDWELEAIFKAWLTSNNGSSYCKVCCVDLRSHRTDLIRHAKTEKHKSKASKIAPNQLTLSKVGLCVTNNSMKKKEIILAAYIATHSSVNSVDHLSDILNEFSQKDAPSTSRTQRNEDMFNIHRSKCSALIKNVIAPSILEDLITDLGNSPFSIIVDESTDVSTEKLLCINIRYYSVKKNDIVIHFLTFITVTTTTTAADLYEAISSFFLKNKINIKNLIGVATDGASNMCGEHNSLYTLLKKNTQLDNLILIKCICHSLHLCCSKASEIFSDETDFLLKETYNWFKHSTVRLSKYREIYNLINTDKKFTKFVQLSNTRWLSRHKAVEKILNNYLELETFFNINADKERCHTAKLLRDAFHNKKNKLIQIFLHPILQQVHELNLYFQKSNIDYYQAFTEINGTIWTFARQILKPSLIEHLDNNLEKLQNSMLFPQNYMKPENCDLGFQFQNELQSFSNLPVDEINETRNKCVEFLKILIRELVKRMPQHLNVFAQVKNIYPKVILNAIRPKFNELPTSFMRDQNLCDLEIQYRQLMSVQWDDVFQGEIPEDAILFWKKAITLKNAGGDLMFKELSLFAFTLLSLPASNATVERSFSLMNIIKSKLRNRMLLNMLNAIMTVRCNFYVNNICCKNFIPTQSMLSRFNSKMYSETDELLEENAINANEILDNVFN